MLKWIGYIIAIISIQCLFPEHTAAATWFVVGVWWIITSLAEDIKNEIKGDY